MQAVPRRLCMLAALLLALATAIGALSVHALKPRLSGADYQVLQTGVLYQFFHSLGLLATGILAERLPIPLLRTAGWTLLAGIVLFSGSLYLLVAGAPRLVGVLTPVGGLALIVGWLMFAWALWRVQGR